MQAHEHNPTRMQIDVSPPTASVPAGGRFAVSARLRCEPPRDLAGLQLATLQEGVELESVALGPFDGESNEASFDLEAPSHTGLLTYEIRPADTDSLRHTRVNCRAQFTVLIRPHRVLLSAWGLGGAAFCGETLALKVGAKCLDGCALDNFPLEIATAKGDLAAAIQLGCSPWPETKSMYWSEVSVAVPNLPGDHVWTLRHRGAVSAGANGLPHDPADYLIRVTTVDVPRHAVTVRLIEKDTAEALEGAVVRSGPYRSLTDDAGVAHLRVPAGLAAIATWKTGYLPVRAEVPVAGDIDLTLEAETAPSDEIETFWI